MAASLARDAEEVADDVEVLEVVLFVEVPVVLGLPKAARAHVQPGLSLLQADQRCHVLVRSGDLFLALLDDFFGGQVDKALHSTRFILLVGEVAAHDGVDHVLDLGLNLREGSHLLVEHLIVSLLRRLVPLYHF